MNLEKKLGVLDTEYKQMNNFKSRVLEPAITQINEKTDIKIKVEQHKTGRSITGFSFKFKQKQTAISENNIYTTRSKHARSIHQNDRSATLSICSQAV